MTSRKAAVAASTATAWPWHLQPLGVVRFPPFFTYWSRLLDCFRGPGPAVASTRGARVAPCTVAPGSALARGRGAVATLPHVPVGLGQAALDALARGGGRLLALGRLVLAGATLLLGVPRLGVHIAVATFAVPAAVLLAPFAVLVDAAVLRRRLLRVVRGAVGGGPGLAGRLILGFLPRPLIAPSATCRDGPQCGLIVVLQEYRCLVRPVIEFRIVVRAVIGFMWSGIRCGPVLHE